MSRLAAALLCSALASPASAAPAAAAASDGAKAGGARQALPAAADKPAKKSAKATQRPAAKPAARPASPRQALQDQARGLALATETAEAISDEQLAVAPRVLTGDVRCEFDLKVQLQPVAGRPGHFSLRFKSGRYTMVPQATASGAVRLEDKSAGVVWLQIPAKSMLMNARIGQRMVDDCVHELQQREAQDEAVAAASGAGQGLLQAPPPATPELPVSEFALVDLPPMFAYAPAVPGYFDAGLQAEPICFMLQCSIDNAEAFPVLLAVTPQPHLSFSIP